MMTIIRVRIGREARPGPHAGKPYSEPLASTRRLAISYSAVQGYWSRSRHPGPAPPFRSGVRTRMSAAATTYRNASDAPSLSRASKSNADSDSARAVGARPISRSLWTLRLAGCHWHSGCHGAASFLRLRVSDSGSDPTGARSRGRNPSHGCWHWHRRTPIQPGSRNLSEQRIITES